MSYAPFVLAAIALSAVGLTARRKRKPAAAARKPPSGAAPGALSVLRKARIVEAGARDFGDEVTLRRAAAFDLDTTIFRSVDSKAARLMLNDKLSLEPMWSDEAASRALAAFATRARPSPAPALAPDDPLFRFMFDECAFSIEHADGSFMDHLQVLARAGPRADARGARARAPRGRERARESARETARPALPAPRGRSKTYT